MPILPPHRDSPDFRFIFEQGMNCRMRYEPPHQARAMVAFRDRDMPIRVATGYYFKASDYWLRFTISKTDIDLIHTLEIGEFDFVFNDSPQRARATRALEFVVWDGYDCRGLALVRNQYFAGIIDEKPRTLNIPQILLFGLFYLGADLDSLCALIPNSLSATDRISHLVRRDELENEKATGRQGAFIRTGHWKGV